MDMKCDPDAVAIPAHPDFEVFKPKLASGATGDVFKARNRKLDRIVALKLVRAERRVLHENVEQQKRWLSRLEREARTLAKLRHPHVVLVYGFHKTTDGQPFIEMEFVEGKCLKDVFLDLSPSAVTARLERRKRERAIAECIRNLAGAVEYCHTEDVWHRDLKPDNVLIDAKGQPRIIDFGFSQQIQAAAEGVTTDVYGSEGFMAPELRLERTANGQADVYALGAILYYLLLGFPPDGHPPRWYNEELSPELDAICRRATALDKEKRHASASELANDLECFLSRSRRRLRVLLTIVPMLMALIGWALADAARKEAEQAVELRDRRERQAFDAFAQLSDNLLQDRDLAVDPKMARRAEDLLKENIKDVVDSKDATGGTGITNLLTVLATLEMRQKNYIVAGQRLETAWNAAVKGYDYAPSPGSARIDRSIIAAQRAKLEIFRPEGDRALARRWLDRSLTEAEQLDWTRDVNAVTPDPRINLTFNVWLFVTKAEPGQFKLEDAEFIRRLLELLHREPTRDISHLCIAKCHYLLALYAVGSKAYNDAALRCANGLSALETIASARFASPTFRQDQNDVQVLLAFLRDACELEQCRSSDEFSGVFAQKLDLWRRVPLSDASVGVRANVALLLGSVAKRVKAFPDLLTVLETEIAELNAMAKEATRSQPPSPADNTMGRNAP